MRKASATQPAASRYTSSTAFMQPSFSGLLVTCAYLPQTTLPDGVTRPRSEQLTSMTVPLVITPSDVYLQKDEGRARREEEEDDDDDDDDDEKEAGRRAGRQRTAATADSS